MALIEKNILLIFIIEQVISYLTYSHKGHAFGFSKNISI